MEVVTLRRRAQSGMGPRRDLPYVSEAKKRVEYSYLRDEE